MPNIINKISGFFIEVKVELTKVSWPSRNELLGAARVVMIATMILTVYTGILDFVLSKAVTIILK